MICDVCKCTKSTYGVIIISRLINIFFFLIDIEVIDLDDDDQNEIYIYVN